MLRRAPRRFRRFVLGGTSPSRGPSTRRRRKPVASSAAARRRPRRRRPREERDASGWLSMGLSAAQGADGHAPAGAAEAHAHDGPRFGVLEGRDHVDDAQLGQPPSVAADCPHGAEPLVGRKVCLRADGRRHGRAWGALQVAFFGLRYHKASKKRAPMPSTPSPTGAAPRTGGSRTGTVGSGERRGGRRGDALGAAGQLHQQLAQLVAALVLSWSRCWPAPAPRAVGACARLCWTTDRAGRRARQRASRQQQRTQRDENLA